jgi:phage N-6-adenine-methyltransferase
VTGVQRKALMSSVRTNWGTPRKLFESLHQEFQFTLDACASADNAKCVNSLVDGQVDALTVPWRGVVWCNPPYGRQIRKWIEKAWNEARSGATVVMLLPCRTDTSWWHDFCLQGEIRFLRGRLYFDDGGERAPFPSVLVVFRGMVEDAG